MAIEALGKQAFLNLLTTQLQFQDPLKPMESTEFIAQLAQFRALESALETNKALDTLVQGSTAMNNMGAAGLLGKTVEVVGGAISHQAGQTETVSYRLPADATEVFIMVKNEAGRSVKNITIKEAQGQGAHQVIWDGKDNDGNAAPAGTYTYAGVLKDGSGQVGPVRIHTGGEVTGISYEPGGPFATVNGVNVKVEEIVKVLK